MFLRKSHIENAVRQGCEIATQTQSELEKLRAYKCDREAKDAEERERIRKEAHNNRQWVAEGKETGVQSLVIDGGKLWKINGDIYFQPSQTTNQYANAFGANRSSSSTSYGMLSRL